MASASGLSPHHRTEARRLLLRGVTALLADPARVHYTQGPGRWDGIAHRKVPWRGSILPFYGDCSSTATWLLWLVLAHHFAITSDHVNGTGWRSGFTGTLSRHGKPVVHDRNLQVGDLIFYGHGWPYEHVTVSIGGHRCFSHGSEGGPYLLDIDYRGDRALARRYI